MQSKYSLTGKKLRESWMLVFYCLDLLMIRFLQESPFSKKKCY